MKLIQTANWSEASQKAGARVFLAPDIEEAKRQMKLSHPNIVPHTCYWHTNMGRDGKLLWNSYYFVWGASEPAQE